MKSTLCPPLMVGEISCSWCQKCNWGVKLRKRALTPQVPGQWEKARKELLAGGSDGLGPDSHGRVCEAKV